MKAKRKTKKKDPDARTILDTLVCKIEEKRSRAIIRYYDAMSVYEAENADAEVDAFDTVLKLIKTQQRKVK